MVTIRTRVSRMKRELKRLADKPRVLLTVVVIGLFMLWLAGEQVRATFKFLVSLQLAEDSQARKLLQKFPYQLFVVLIIVYLWLDLVLLSKLFTLLGKMFTWFRDLFRRDNSDLEVTQSPKSRAQSRRNPVRACRKSPAL